MAHRDITLTLYAHNKDTNSVSVTRKWSKWVERLTTHTHLASDPTNKADLDRAKNGPAFIAGHVEGPRAKGNVTEIHALTIDLDELTTEEIDEVFEVLLIFEWVAYSTHKHKAAAVDGGERWRIVLPLEEPIPVAQHAEAWERLDSYIGNRNDTNTKDASRLNYLPTTYDPDVAETAHNRGVALRPFKDLPAVEPSAQTSDGPPATPESLKPQELDALRLSITNSARGMGSIRPGPALRTLTKGEPIATEGDRHKIIVSMTWWLATKHPDLTDEDVGWLFNDSIAAMQSQDDAPKLNEAVRAYRDATSKTKPKEHDTYNEDELKRIALAQGVETEKLRRRWILQRAGACWFLDRTGDYVGAFPIQDAQTAAPYYLRRAPVRLNKSTENGLVPRPLGQVVVESGNVLTDVVIDLSLQRSKLAGTVLRHAKLPLRIIEPKFDTQIDEWLHILAGQQYSKLQDWLVCVPSLDRLICGLYLHGPKACGKTLIAHGLAKLWADGGPADPNLVIGTAFNDELLRCPLMLCDEEVPKPRTKQTSTGLLRTFISTMHRSINAKNQPATSIYGAMRLVIAGNSAFLLDNKDVNTNDDVEAIEQRFFYLRVPQSAADYLNEISSETKNEWVENGIAAHTLAVSKQFEVIERGKRFWVEGAPGSMEHLLEQGGYWNDIVIEWLIRIALAKDPTQRTNKAVLIGGGKYHVNATKLVPFWEAFMPHLKKVDPHTTKINHVIREMSSGSVRKMEKGERGYYSSINVQDLAKHAEVKGFCTKEEFLNAVGITQPIEVDFKLPKEEASNDGKTLGPTDEMGR